MYTSQNSVEGIVTRLWAVGQRDRGSISSRGKKFFSPQKRRVFLRPVQRSVCEPNCLSLSNI